MLVLISSLFILFREGVSILFSMIYCKDVVLFNILMMETTSTLRQQVDNHGAEWLVNINDLDTHSTFFMSV